MFIALLLMAKSQKHFEGFQTKFHKRFSLPLYRITTAVGDKFNKVIK
jgi:hypothetical protein